MSRIGNLKIVLPEKVDVVFNRESGEIAVKGPRGEVDDIFLNGFEFVKEDNFITVKIKSQKDNYGKEDSFQGLYRTILQNMIIGVTKGFEKKLELIGVGYKAVMNGPNILELDLGYSHKVLFVLPKEIVCKVEAEKGKNIIIILSGNEKYLVGQIAAKIKSLRSVEPYKGKGFRYLGETIKLKAGKTTAAKK